MSLALLASSALEMDLEAMVEDNSWLRDSPSPLSEPPSVPSKSKRGKKPLDMDEVLMDFYREQQKKTARAAKKARVRVADPRSDDQDRDDPDVDFLSVNAEQEVRFESLMETCERTVRGDGLTAAVPKWGMRVFGIQKQGEIPPLPAITGLCDEALSASHTVQTRFSLENVVDDGLSKEKLLEQLLVGGWLFPLTKTLRQCDHTTMEWLFHHMSYSNEKAVEVAACDFLCKYLLLGEKDSKWKPSYNSIMNVFEVYGYEKTIQDMDTALSKERDNEDNSGDFGPPRNLLSLLKFLTTCCKSRHLKEVFSTNEVENLVDIISMFVLDRHLLTFFASANECLVSLLDYFTADEWRPCCDRISKLLSRSDRQLCNSVRLTQSLRGAQFRMKQLQKKVALNHLNRTFNDTMGISPNALKVISTIRKAYPKLKKADFVLLYYQLILADIWLWSNRSLTSNKLALESWLLFLTSCSCQISSTDVQLYASKVRNLACYLKENYELYR